MTPQEIEQTLYKYLEEYSVESYPSEHRNHLGASSIGDECWRKLWYTFRWVKLGQAEGRMRRLWNRGHREEPVFEEFLIWAGIRIKTINPETDKQYVFSKVNGHYGGSTDGIAIITWADKLEIIGEFKTFGSKYFEKLKKEKVKLSNPKYYKQMVSYGKEFKCRNGLFCAVNKDNDEVYFEFVDLDWSLADEMEKKATDIIYAQLPPPRISEQPAYWLCKGCTFNGICHHGEAVEKNCRSCVHAVPAEKAQWGCGKFGQLIPKDFLKVGCNEHKGIV